MRSVVSDPIYARFGLFVLIVDSILFEQKQKARVALSFDAVVDTQLYDGTTVNSAPLIVHCTSQPAANMPQIVSRLPLSALRPIHTLPNTQQHHVISPGLHVFKTWLTSLTPSTNNQKSFEASSVLA